jgi:hypothetical protein
MKVIAGLLDMVPGWVWAIAVAGLAATSFKLTMDLGAVRLEVGAVKLAKSKLETQVAQASADAASMAASFQSNVVKAQNDAKAREIPLRLAAAAALSESDSLRDDLATLRMQLDSATHDAAVNRAVAIGDVLGQCAKEYQGLAERADRHANDLKTLIQAWPQTTNLPTK